MPNERQANSGGLTMTDKLQKVFDAADQWLNTPMHRSRGLGVVHMLAEFSRHHDAKTMEHLREFYIGDIDSDDDTDE